MSKGKQMTVIYQTIVGSRLYGIHNEESDTDVEGIFMPPIEHTFGIEGGRKQETRTFHNDAPDGPDKVEGTLHSLREYFRLAVKGNPNLLEVPFAAPEYHEVCTEVGQRVIEFARTHFLTKKVIPAYFNYFKHEYITIQTKPKEHSKDRRKILYDTHGYDTKAAGHAYRLATQVIQVLEKGTLDPTLQGDDRKLVMDLRAGKVSKEEALSLLDGMKHRMSAGEQTTQIPDEPDMVAINKFLVDVQKDFYFK
jgi:predicted nucleotidyltransferase